MRVLTTEIPGVLIIEPRVFSDSRGCFFESFQAERYHQYGINLPFVQDNISHSVKNTVRGLHYQLEKPQGKLVYVSYGKVLDVVLDIRLNSPTFGKAIWFELDDVEHKQIYIPPGLAHGFSVLSERAGFNYKCTDYYSPSAERGVRWDDPDLNIQWQVENPLLSPKDTQYVSLKDIPKDQLFL